MKEFAGRFLFFIVTIFLTASCVQQDKPMKVAVSYISGNPDESNYIKWLKSVDTIAEFVIMNKISLDSVELVFDDCSALLLTGGKDVYPGRYGQAEDTVKCGTIDFYRDSLEFLLIDLAIDRETPIMGICRGQQILNVAFGGSLIVDIPTEIDSRVYHRCQDWQNCFHDVRVFKNNILAEISGVNYGNVTTNHHQAIKKLADQFKVMAVSNDGVIEAIGWKEPAEKSYLMAVQWHPERMDNTNKLSYPLAEQFLSEARKFYNK
jgi:putative glutamine amidotransferase